MAQALSEPIERWEPVLYCSHCGARMRVSKVVRDKEGVIRYWACCSCRKRQTGKTVEMQNTYRRH